MEQGFNNYYLEAILRFRLHMLETIASNTSQGVTALLQLLDFIDYYQLELNQIGAFGPQNEALVSIVILRNTIVQSLNNVTR